MQHAYSFVIKKLMYQTPLHALPSE